MDPRAPSSGRHAWKEANHRGLAFATLGEWSAAAGEFDRARELLALAGDAHIVTRDELDDARATLSSNMSQVHLRAGNLKDARRFSEHACALRVALYGEHALTVARTRSDLAVILAVGSHVNEAVSLIDRTVASLARSQGPHNAEQIPLLQNAARMSIAVEALIAARNYATRLELLLRARGDSTGCADEIMTAIRLHATPTEDGSFNLVEAPPPTLSSVPIGTGKTRKNLLGFDVQYGIPQEHHEPLISDDDSQSPPSN